MSVSLNANSYYYVDYNDSQPALTFGTWFMPKVNGVGVISQRNSPGSLCSITLLMNNLNNIQFSCIASNNITYTGSSFSLPNLNQWYNISIKYNDVTKTAICYVDGVAKSVISYLSTLTTNNRIYFGGIPGSITNSAILSPYVFNTNKTDMELLAIARQNKSFYGNEGIRNFWWLDNNTNVKDNCEEHDLNIVGSPSTSSNPTGWSFLNPVETLNSKKLRTQSLELGYKLTAFVGPFKYQGWDENNVFAGSNYTLTSDWTEVSSICTNWSISHGENSTTTSLSGVNFNEALLTDDRAMLFKVQFHPSTQGIWSNQSDYYLGYIISGSIKKDWNTNNWSLNLEGDYYYLNQTNVIPLEFGAVNVAKNKSAVATSTLIMSDAEKTKEGFLGNDVSPSKAVDSNLDSVFISEGVPSTPKVKTSSKTTPTISEVYFPRTAENDYRRTQFTEIIYYNSLAKTKGGLDERTSTTYPSVSLKEFGVSLDGSGHDYQWYHENVWIHPTQNIKYFPGGQRNESREFDGNLKYSFQTVVDWNGENRKVIKCKGDKRVLQGNLRTISPYWMLMLNRGIWDTTGREAGFKTPTAWQTAAYTVKTEVWYDVWVKANLPNDGQLYYFRVTTSGGGGHASTIKFELATGQWQNFQWRFANVGSNNEQPRYAIAIVNSRDNEVYDGEESSFYVGYQEIVGGYGDTYPEELWKKNELAIEIRDETNVLKYTFNARQLNFPNLGGAKRVIFCDDSTLFGGQFSSAGSDQQVLELKNLIPNLFIRHDRGWKVILKRNSEWDYYDVNIPTQRCDPLDATCRRNGVYQAIPNTEIIYDVVTLNSITTPAADVGTFYNNTYNNPYPTNYNYSYGRFTYNTLLTRNLRSENSGNFDVNKFPSPGEVNVGKREALMVNLGSYIPLTLDGNINATVNSISIADASSQLAYAGRIVIGNEWISYSGNSNDILSNCIRGVSTTAVLHLAGDLVYPLLQNATGDWFQQELNNIVALGLIRKKDKSLNSKYKIIYSKKPNPATPWSGSDLAEYSNTYESHPDWLEIPESNVSQGGTWVAVNNNSSNYRIHFKGNTDNNPPTWPPPENYYADPNIVGTMMSAFCIISENMTPEDRFKLNEVVAYAKNPSASSEGGYQSKFAPDIKSILGYYYISKFAPVYNGTANTYMTRFHTETKSNPLLSSITTHYGEMSNDAGKIAAIMQSIAKKVGFRIFVDRYNHLFVMPVLEHVGLWHPDSNFTFNQYNTHSINITKNPAWKVAQTKVKATDLQKHKFSVAYPSSPYKRGDIIEIGENIVGSKEEAEVLARIKFAYENRGWEIDLTCGIADWLERGMKVLVNIPIDDQFFQNVPFYVDTWTENISFDTKNWTTNIKLIEQRF